MRKNIFFVNEKPHAVSGKGSLFFYPQQGKECFTYAAALWGLTDVNPKLVDNHSWRRAAHASRQVGVSRAGTRHRPRSWEAPLLSPSSPTWRGAAMWTAIGSGDASRFQAISHVVGQLWCHRGNGSGFLTLQNVVGVLEKFPIPLEQSQGHSKFGENCRVANGQKDGVQHRVQGCDLSQWIGLSETSNLGLHALAHKKSCW